MTDFDLTDNGSIYLLSPLTEVADEWIHDNLPDKLYGIGGSVAIESRFVSDIVDGILADGLTVDGWAGETGQCP